MRLDAKTVSKLDLSTSASDVVTKPLDHFPWLILDRCLEEAASELVAQTAAAFTDGYSVQGETLTMPRRGFGPRPVLLTSSPARVLYQALVNTMSPDLVEPTRAPGKWDRHEDFGVSGEHSHLVEFDIASCYEYVEHKRLHDELLVRTMRPAEVRGLTYYLGELCGQDRGLPQMLGASDRLADTYLSKLERQLLLDGETLSRFVDDFRVISSSWEHGNSVIERAAEYAGALGMILSSEKTAVRRRDRLELRRTKERNLLSAYSTAAELALALTVMWNR
jgi:RNA-directed DNA polymerase